MFPQSMTKERQEHNAEKKNTIILEKLSEVKSKTAEIKYI